MKSKFGQFLSFLVLVLCFTACDDELKNPKLPVITTSEMSLVTFETARGGGVITDTGSSGIVQKGVCWSTKPEPTINDRCTKNGTGTGTFTSILTQLQTATDYYVRAYATNSQGTAYGEEVHFSTMGTVYNPVTGKTWLDRNLGATRVARWSGDRQAFGDLYQWGRLTDGHEKRNSELTTTISSGYIPGHDRFIISSNTEHNWIATRMDHLWQGFQGVNNPCPLLFRLPTEQEWLDEIATWSSVDSTGAINSILRLPCAGVRSMAIGNVKSEGSGGIYWSSTTYKWWAVGLSFGPTRGDVYTHDRASGYSVRCIRQY